MPRDTTSGRPQGKWDAQKARQERIRERVLAEGSVQIEQLAEEFSVNLMTIHRDLDALQQQGWLRKVRGGATAQPSALFHGDIRHRMQTMKEAKQELARTAIKIVEPGQSVMLDESTTDLYLAQLLPSQGPLTVISYFHTIMKLFMEESGIDLIGLGGTYYPAYDSFLGLLTTQTIRSLRADLLFMSATAVTEGFCYHLSPEITLVKRALMEAASRRILMLDHSKFSKRSLYQLAPLTDFDLVIVDQGTSERDLAAMRDFGVVMHVAGTESEQGQELLALLDSSRSTDEHGSGSDD
jgi:DeoR/GlpR family transcriptional regulator of sugar metabolism